VPDGGEESDAMLVLHTFGTPHGHRASIMLEECGLDYAVKVLTYEGGRVLDPGFCDLSPLSKFPVLVEEADDRQTPIFGSGAILSLLAGRTGRFLPTDPGQQVDFQCWLMLVLTDFTPVTIGHFRFNVLAPEHIPYAIDLYAREVRRNLDALDRRLGAAPYLAGADYTIADIAAWPFVDAMAAAGDLTASHPHLARWHALIGERPAVRRGMRVPDL